MTDTTGKSVTEALLDQISHLSLEFEDMQKMNSIIMETSSQLDDSEEVVEIFKRYCHGVIRNVEVDKKCAKRLIPNFITSIQMLNCNEKVIDEVFQLLVSLPMMLQSRWDIITMLASSGMVKKLDDVLFKEVMACASDQDLAARCSSTVLQMAANANSSSRAAAIIYKGLTSPVFAVRNNVHRSWLCRIINMKSSKSCIEQMLELCRDEVSKNKSKMWPVAHREVPGLTCVDLEWRPVLDQEPFDNLTFTLLAYYAVLIALKHSSSQVHVKLKNTDEVVMKGIEFFGAVAAKQALIVCSKYKIYPPTLEKAILCEISSQRNPDIYEIVDDEMLKSFSKETQMIFTKEKLKYLIAEQKTTKDQLRKENDNHESLHKLDKFYPAEDHGCFTVEVNLHAEQSTIATLDRFLKVQHPTLEYPSVAAVMEHLSSQNIDERLFCQKVITISDLVYSKYTNRKFGWKMYTEFVFKMITRIPLRSVVDYVGGTIKAEANKDGMFREKIFMMACELMEKEQENARPLSLYHCFLSTCHLETAKINEIWYAIMDLKNTVKKRKMAEMLAKVITSSEVQVDTETLYDISLCCLGLHPARFDTESTQLFVAAISKLLDFRSESERIMLFQAAAHTPIVMKLISDILLHPVNLFSNSAFQMVLYFFTRFHVGSLQFYADEEHLTVIAKIVNFCHWCIRKFAVKPMILSIAVDAICGFLPWSYLRHWSLLKEGELNLDDVENPVEKLIIGNLRHNRLCLLLNEHDKPDTYLTLEDFEKFPKAQFIVDIVKKRDSGLHGLTELAYDFMDIVKNTNGFEEIHVIWLAYGMLSDIAIEMIEEAEQHRDTDPNWKSRYPPRALMDSLIDVGAGFHAVITDLRMVNSWLDKGLAKIRYLTDREFNLNDCPCVECSHAEFYN